MCLRKKATIMVGGQPHIVKHVEDSLRTSMGGALFSVTMDLYTPTTSVTGPHHFDKAAVSLLSTSPFHFKVFIVCHLESALLLSMT